MKFLHENLFCVIHFQLPNQAHLIVADELTMVKYILVLIFGVIRPGGLHIIRICIEYLF